ncbi:hypothetical protein pb186bvf_013984 [Paramecium bursaria]
MSTDTDILQKFLEEYNGLKRENQSLTERCEKYSVKEQEWNQTNMKINQQSMQFQNEYQQMQQEINRLKRENQKLIEQNSFLSIQMDQLKELYQETKQELQQSFKFIQSFNRKPQQICRQSLDTKLKTGTFENDEEDKFVLKEKSQNTLETNYYKFYIDQLLEIFAVSSVDQLILAADKIRQVMVGVQQMEQFCRQICDLVIEEGEFNNFEVLIGAIQKWKLDSQYVDCFVQFKQQLETTLGLQNSNETQIFEQIKSLQQQQRQGESNSDQDNINKLKQLFQITDEPFMFSMNQIYVLLQDIQLFIKLIKRQFELDENFKNNDCLMFVLKYCEQTKKDNSQVRKDIITDVLKSRKDRVQSKFQ